MQKKAGSGDGTSRGRDTIPEPIRVAHLSSGHHADDARVFWKECLSLARAGYDVSLTVPEEYPSRLPGLPAEVQVSVVRNRPGRFGRLVVTPWVLLVAGLRRKADIYHIHEPELLLSGLLLRLSGKKVIYDVHEDFPRDILVKGWIPAVFRGPAAAAAGTLEWFAGRTLSGVIAATPTIARRFPSGRTALVQNFARISEFTTCAAGPRDDCPALAYIGGITVDRCAPEMVQALARLERFPDVRLIMAGPIHPPGLQDTLTALPGWRQVDYRGHQDRPGILSILARARIGLVLFHHLQNYIDSLPVKLFEYMAAGMPVVAADFPRFREIVEGNRCGFCVPSRDVAAVAQAIDWLLAHPAEADEMGRRGREAALNLFSWESEERALLCFYRHITQGAVLPPAFSEGDRTP
jgi:glycosyltransferase involved in cell wall biosynthesis